MVRMEGQRRGAQHSARESLRLAHKLADDVARLGSYALTNQSRAEAAVHEVVQAFDTLASAHPRPDAVHGVAVGAIDSLMRLKRLLSTPTTRRIVPEQVRTAIFEELALLETHAAHIVRGTPRTPPRASSGGQD